MSKHGFDKQVLVNQLGLSYLIYIKKDDTPIVFGDNYIQFLTKKFGARINKIKIEYDSVNDAYNIQFFYVDSNTGVFEIVKNFEEIYFDNLHDVINETLKT